MGLKSYSWSRSLGSLVSRMPNPVLSNLAEYAAGVHSQSSTGLSSIGHQPSDDPSSSNDHTKL